MMMMNFRVCSIVLMLLGGFLRPAQATVVEGVDLRIGLWDAEGRITEEIMAASSRAEALGEDFEYEPGRLYLAVAGPQPDTWSGRRIDLNINSIGRSFRYTGPRELQFYSEPIPAEATESLPAAAPLIRYSLPEQATNLLLLFIPRMDDSKQSHEVLTVDMSGAQFPRGTLRVHNLSDQRLLLACGEEQHALEGGGEVVFRPDPADPFQVRVAGWDPVREDWRIRLNKFQPRIADNRRLCLIINDPHRPNRVQCRFFRVE